MQACTRGSGRGSGKGSSRVWGKASKKIKAEYEGSHLVNHPVHFLCGHAHFDCACGDVEDFTP